MSDAAAINAAALNQLFAQRAAGFTKDLPGYLPRPWDAPPPRQAGDVFRPAPYLIDDELAAAAWVALLLRQPLLLTGDPGVGKTRFAEKLAADLGLGEPTLVQVKSTTAGRDLLYQFDDLMRFRDATVAGAVARQTSPQQEAQAATGKEAAAEKIRNAERPLTAYVRLEGLGRAILRAAGASFPIALDPDFDPAEVFGTDIAARSRSKSDGKSGLTLGDVFPQEFPDQAGPRHTLVLIDELDKAPRDTPNDLLGEIERMIFRFDELGFSVAADPQFKPIVVITSNAERNLPDAFLRRCIFHNIATPNREKMCKIAAARLGGLDPDSTLIKEAWELFEAARKGITEKQPGTAEFIALVAYLRATDDGKPLSEERKAAAQRIFNKTKQDLATADSTVAAASARP